MPALLTRMSTPPKASTAVSTSVRAPSQSATSLLSAIASPAGGADLGGDLLGRVLRPPSRRRRHGR